MSESYTIEIWRAASLGSTPELLRTHQSTTPEGAETLIESLRESYEMREAVEWDSDMVDEEGKLHGHSDAAVYMIVVTPPLRVPQS